MIVGMSKRPMLWIMLPFIILISVLLVCVVWTVFTSFTDKALIGKAAIYPSFIGIKNYTRLLHHPSFLNSLKVSMIFSVCSGILGQSVIGLALAVSLKKKRKGRSFLEFSVLMGWLIPDIVAAFMWGAFASKSGFLNTVFLVPFGLNPINWLTSNPLMIIIIANIWKGTAWSYLLFSAALDTIPEELFEACIADGAGVWQKFTNVTFPLIFPKIIMNLLLITIWTFGYFPLVYGITGGGPGHATEILPILMYKEAFESFNIGYGSAISIVMALIVGSFSFIYFIALKRTEDVY
jgi:multiple sugar transport system permease protein